MHASSHMLVEIPTGLEVFDTNLVWPVAKNSNCSAGCQSNGWKYGRCGQAFSVQAEGPVHNNERCFKEPANHPQIWVGSAPAVIPFGRCSRV